MDLEENDVIDQSSLKYNLLGRLYTNKTVNTNAMYSFFKKSWNPTKGVEFKELQNGFFYLQFACQANVHKVEELGPWCFHTHIVPF